MRAIAIESKKEENINKDVVGTIDKPASLAAGRKILMSDALY